MTLYDYLYVLLCMKKCRWGETKLLNLEQSYFWWKITFIILLYISTDKQSCSHIQNILCMTLNDSVWFCMTMYYSVWICQTMYDFKYIWVCFSSYDSVSLCMNLYDFVRNEFLILYNPLLNCMTMIIYDSIGHYMIPQDSSWLCLALFDKA